MTFTDKLEYLMEKKGIKNKSQLSKQSGIPYTTIVGFFEKGTENIRRTTLIKLSDFFNCSLEYLVSDEITDENYGKAISFSINSDEIMHIKKYRTLDEYGKKAVDGLLDNEYERCTAVAEEPEATPLFEIRNSVYKVSAGTGYQLDVEEWETIEIPDTYENRQADFTLTISGNSMEPVYHDGDIVLVKQQPQVEPGEIGIFIINDEGFIKKFGGDRLISLNEDYNDILFSEDDFIKCCGKVIGRV
ncbi:MAG: helix-turn-helix domain-containing protein [Oscillospiraceae bacterium]